jgi:hypothetical protein
VSYDTIESEPIGARHARCVTRRILICPSQL